MDSNVLAAVVLAVYLFGALATGTAMLRAAGGRDLPAFVRVAAAVAVAVVWLPLVLAAVVALASGRALRP